MSDINKERAAALERINDGQFVQVTDDAAEARRVREIEDEITTAAQTSTEEVKPATTDA